jgi:acylphosphatase
MSNVHLVISGDVQGVGYRKWALKEAQNLQVVGWVKNREDKAVEIVASAPRSVLDIFISRCRKGPELAVVKDVYIASEDSPQEFEVFSVIY